MDITSLDRFTEGRTAVNIFTAPDADSQPVSLTRYEQYPDECFDIIWPRIDEGDIVLFGGFYALDSRMRPRLSRFLNNCVERKALLIYLPGFLPQQAPRITHVMPAIFENLEIADVVFASSEDLKYIFGKENPADCYRDHIDFYCRSLIAVDTVQHTLDYFSGNEHSSSEISCQDCRTMLWNAGAVAGVVSTIMEQDITSDILSAPGAAIRQTILNSAILSAGKAVKNISSHWQHIS